MSERLGGAFPGERTERRGGPSRGSRPERREESGDRMDARRRPGAERAERAYRPGNAVRPGPRRPVPGAGIRAGRPARQGSPGGQSGYAPRPRPGAGGYRADGSDADHRRAATSPKPRIPDSITEDQISREAKAELRGLPADLAASVGRYLVAAELASDPEQAYRYAQAARAMAARIGVVREVNGIMAYRTGRWSQALAELRAARRLTGRGEYLPMMADAERALGHLDRALELVHSDDAKRLPRAAQVELRIVESGIRRDQGMADAAVLALQVPELSDGVLRPWSARLFYAYGDALLAADRPEAAREAFSRAVVADEDQETDALARLDELDGIWVEDLEEADDSESETDFEDHDGDLASEHESGSADEDEGEDDDDELDGEYNPGDLANDDDEYDDDDEELGEDEEVGEDASESPASAEAPTDRSAEDPATD